MINPTFTSSEIAFIDRWCRWYLAGAELKFNFSCEETDTFDSYRRVLVGHDVEIPQRPVTNVELRGKQA